MVAPFIMFLIQRVRLSFLTTGLIILDLDSGVVELYANDMRIMS